MEIQVVHQPDESKLGDLGVRSWPIWTKEASEFPWTYDESETCYFLAGDVIVTPNGGTPVAMGQGDLVTFPAGMRCTWKIRDDVKKHYKFG
ncbi:cupin domain-containing protein [filamentous cyanobacterium LEGE 11480]|uniref:Cupin domain-containing protein n=1 Tax=Romeriopsis navalis LEGE 11480 TaxID=2777977 RepID=A0A928VS10_9CYAN|nr:cupin domain-containing protein [Romeriopsis navalis]MBE9032697.1 cupin domain-containing protein [Romeriopsis navalis LEGE 11480]